MPDEALLRALADGARVIRLGTLFAHPNGAGGNLTIEHRSDMRLEGFELDEEWFAFVSSLVPTEIADGLSAEQGGFLAALGGAGGAWIVGPHSTPSDLDVVVVPRTPVTLAAADEMGFTFETADGAHFNLSEFGMRLFAQIDGTSTLREMAAVVMSSALADPEDREVVARAEAASGRSFDSLFMDEVLGFVTAIVESGSASIEPVA
ncbi:hypothetical protein [Microbacterium sp. NPDC057650]|uniref:hypothetical protein n=1 Tax=unclassified Microbacterium TaxID=2609290 RepID=UPI00366BE995